MRARTGWTRARQVRVWAATATALLGQGAGHSDTSQGSGLVKPRARQRTGSGQGLHARGSCCGGRVRVTRARQLGPVTQLMVVQGFGTLGAEGEGAQGKGRALEEM